MTRLVQADRKATVSDINTHHNSAMKTAKCRTCQTMNWMGYNSKRSRWVQLQSAKNRKLRQYGHRLTKMFITEMPVIRVQVISRWFY